MGATKRVVGILMQRLTFTDRDGIIVGEWKEVS